MKLKGINFTAKISAIGIMLLLTLAVSCQATEAPATVSEGPATSELNVDLLGTRHTYFLHGEGRLAGNVVLESPDRKVTLSMISGTTLLDKDGKPLTFLQLQADPNPPNPLADAQIIGTVYDLTPHGATSNPPLMLTLPYRPEDLPKDVQEKDLYIASYDEENGWGKSARGYKIMSIPTQVIFDENGQEITRHIGYWSMEEILAELEQVGVK
jgi:hypothetical protein